jgi:hypothetical protein
MHNTHRLPPVLQPLLQLATEGKLSAAFSLGVALVRLGGDRNHESGFYWIEYAAKRGHVEAQAAAGIMAETGLGVEANPAVAYMWYELAAASGNERSAILRDHLAERLSVSEFGMAEYLVSTWRPIPASRIDVEGAVWPTLPSGT